MTKEKELSPIMIRTSEKKGEPALIFSTASNYTWIWSTSKNHGGDRATIWRPVPATSDWLILGDFVQQGYGNPVGSSLIVKAVNDDPGTPLLKAPQAYNEIWNDHGSGGEYDGSIWSAKPHDGYLAVGCLGQTGYDQPNIANYACIRRDLVQALNATQLIWWDQGSHAHMDVSCWAIPGVANAFVAQPNYQQPYQGSAYAPKGLQQSKG
jgi:hypothetical protein